ncbi:MAG: phosphatidylserine decarboxylase [Candidatus Saccharibacteria bacterium]|nr:phosphatidylserine decarboxylase [Candidatus Saccharibacteria bacterium]
MPVISYIFFGSSLFLFLFWKIVFLRNPKRTVPKGNVVVAPASGKIIEVLEYHKNQVQLYKGNKRYLGIINTLTEDVAPSGTIISIFMSPMDVHQNRAPIAGKVVSVVHSDGKFLAVNTLEAGLVNEKSEIVIKSPYGNVKMIQIAGFLARRVVTHVKPGDTVATGGPVGLINLGSQVTVILPSNMSVVAKKGDKVVSGESIIANFNS